MRLDAMRLLAAFFEQADVLGLRLPGNREPRNITAADDLGCKLLCKVWKDCSLHR